MREFPSGPVLKAELSLPRAPVPFLVGELRSSMCEAKEREGDAAIFALMALKNDSDRIYTGMCECVEFL